MRNLRVLGIAAAMVLAACAGSTETEPPPATRATVAPSPVTTPVEVETAASDPVTETTEADVIETSAPAPELEYSIAFEDIGAGVEAGTITVPLDYDDPAGTTLQLYVTRHKTTSDGRVGSLLSNPGGPGLSASVMATNVRAYFDDPLIDRFDIVSWDPRGTGDSGGSVDCIEGSEYDRFFGSSDITPDDDAERTALIELAEEYATRCVDAVGDALAHLGTNNTARDMDAIRQALGEDQISYFGFSYGSELGAVWATLFPDTVRAAVLDGAAHPDPNGIEPLKRQYLGFDRALSTFLAECSDDSGCEFHNDGDAEGAFDRLLEQIDESPLPGPPGRPDINLEIATTGVIQAMYSDRRWPALERVLDDAANGDGTGLLALYDSYLRRDPADGSYPNLLESFQAIICADEPDRLTPDEADKKAEELIGVAPRLFPYTTASYVCNFFPPSADPRTEITGERAGPIVVIGTTGDPSTPLDSSEAMADALEEGQLVTVEANQHLGYGTSDCINDLVHDYLIWLEAPATDARCS